MREITTPGLNMAVAVRDADEVDLAAYAVQTGEAEPALADVPASVLAAHRRRRSLTGATTDVTAVMWSTPHTVHEEAGRRRRLEAGAEYAGPMVAFTLYDGGGDEIDVTRETRVQCTHGECHRGRTADQCSQVRRGRYFASLDLVQRRGRKSRAHPA